MKSDPYNSKKGGKENKERLTTTGPRFELFFFFFESRLQDSRYLSVKGSLYEMWGRELTSS